MEFAPVTETLCTNLDDETCNRIEGHKQAVVEGLL
jgi:hypothetical protein